MKLNLHNLACIDPPPSPLLMSSPRSPLMLVDGYNVIGTWRSLQSLRDDAGFETARQHLTEALANYSAYQGYKTTLVFDAYNNQTAAVTEVITQHLKLHYTEYRQTADSYIEKFCGQMFRDPIRRHHRVIVVTSDRAQQLTTQGFGAEWMSAEKLQAEVEITFKQEHRKRQHKSQTAKAKTIASQINQDVRDRLNRLRYGL